MRRICLLTVVLLCVCASAWAQEMNDSLQAALRDAYNDSIAAAIEDELPPINIEDIFGDTIFYDDDANWYPDEPTETLRDASDLINYGARFLGIRYRYGGTTPAGFDCSGFTRYVFAHFDIRLSRTADGQAAQYPRINRRDIQPGDLVYFAGRDGGSRIGHVGIVSEVLEDGTFKFIHSSCSRGITFSRSTETYYAPRIRAFNRPCTAFSGNYGKSEMDNSNPF